MNGAERKACSALNGCWVSPGGGCLVGGENFADLGADVIKVEPPRGSPSRNVGPFYKDVPDPEKSLFWFAYNTSKRGITLDIEKADGQETFKRLVKTADIIIESFPVGYMDGLGLGYSVLEELRPEIVMTSITPYGQSGPKAHYKGSDLAEEVEIMMQAAGVAAAAVAWAEDLYSDPQLKHRGHFRWLDWDWPGRPEGQCTAFDGPAFRLSKTPDSQWAPDIYGQHDQYVLKEFLGLSDDNIADLLAERVLTTEEDIVPLFGL